MADRLALDTNAVADYLREYRTEPPQIADSGQIFQLVDRAAALWVVLQPDRRTARLYGEISGAKPLPAGTSPTRERARRNDLWIAALCLQHKLPLLSNDRDFDGIEGLEVIHW